MKLARDWITEHGGVEATRVFTRIWLALFGLWSWDDLPVMPPELIYLPSWFPLNIYDWGCWARQTIVALTVVQSFRPSRPIGLSIDELKTGGPHGRAPRPRRDLDARPVGGRPAPRTAGPLLQRPRQALQRSRPVLPPPPSFLYRPVKSVRRAALRRCAEWIVARQEKDGCWGGIQPPWVYSLIALNLLGYALDHPVMAKGIAGLDRFTIIEDTPGRAGRRLEACQSPVWDTALAMIALADAGRAARRPVADPGRGRWLLGRGDPRPGRLAGAPAEAAARRLGVRVRQRQLPRHRRHRRGGAGAAPGRPTGDAGPAIDRGPGPGWPGCSPGTAAGAPSTRTTPARCANKLPFCDFGAVIDPPTADVTAHVVEMLAAEGRAAEPAAQAAAWTGCCEPGDRRLLVRPLGRQLRLRHRRGGAGPDRGRGRDRPSRRSAAPCAGWRSTRTPTAAGARTCAPTIDPAGRPGRRPPPRRPRGRCSRCSPPASGTTRPPSAASRGSPQTQTEDGTWDEPWFTGTGFPVGFLHQLPPVPAGLPRHRPRQLRPQC